MNRIEMYSSSADLRVALHRVLATAAALSSELTAGVRFEWWSDVEVSDREAAQGHRSTLDALRRAYSTPRTLETVNEVRSNLGLDAVDREALQAAFRAAIISGKAYRAHGGRDVYGLSNKQLWDLVCAPLGHEAARRFGPALGEGPVCQAESQPSATATELLSELIAFDTSPEGDGHEACVEWLRTRLRQLDFETETVGGDLGRPIVVARRSARGGFEGHAVLYGHYDVTPYGREDKWRFPPRRLTRTDGRLFARGVADNKGPLACRLAALEDLHESPALTWLIQGEEETGSPVAHELLPAIMAELSPTIWIDETGYHDHTDGALRLLARTVGPSDESHPVDAAQALLLRGLAAHATRWGIASRHENRGLNKSVVAGGCPFNKNLPMGARYVALGVNDSNARIHGVNESLPGWTFPLHAEQLGLVFAWANWVARTTS